MASAGDAAAFEGLKRLWDMLFLLGTTAYGVGVVAAMSGEAPAERTTTDRFLVRAGHDRHRSPSPDRPKAGARRDHRGNPTSGRPAPRPSGHRGPTPRAPNPARHDHVNEWSL